MTIVYRTGNDGKGEELTWEEVDGNFSSLDLRLTDVEGLVTGNPVLQVQGTQLVLATPGGGSAVVDLGPLVDGIDNDTRVSTLGFNTGSGVLTLTESDGNQVGVDLDGRYIQVGNETNQTLGVSGTDLIIYANDGSIANSVSMSGLVGSALTYNDIQVSNETPSGGGSIAKVAISSGTSFRIEYTPADLTPYLTKDTLSSAADVTLDYVTGNGNITLNDITVGHIILNDNSGAVTKRSITGPDIIELNPTGTNSVTSSLPGPEADGTVVVLGNLLVEGSTTTLNSDSVAINGGAVTFYNSRSGVPGVDEDAVITVYRGTTTQDAKLFWDEGENNWRLTTPDDTSTLGTSSDRIITDADHYVTNVTGEDGIEIDNSGIASNGTSVHTTANASSLTIGLGAQSIANDRLINSTITLGDGTSTFDEVALGETLNIVGDTDLSVTVTDNTFTIDHDNVGPTGGATIGNASTPPVNEFVDYIEISETGHVLDVGSSPIDWDAAGNVGFKYISGDNTNEDSTSLISNYIEADNNTAEFTIQGGDDIETVINSGLDTVIINNTSTLDTVTSRGAVTTNDITVGNLTADDIYTTTGNIYGPGNIRIDAAGDSTTSSENPDGLVTINGDLEVWGYTTTIHSNNVFIGDSLIYINHDAVGAPTEDAGLVVERGDEVDVSIYWDETDDVWKVSDGSSTPSRIITDADEYVKDVIGVDGISIAPNLGDSSVETFDTSNAAELTIGLNDNGIANIKLENSTISLSDGTSTYDEVALGETLSIVGGDDLSVTVTDNTFTVDHNTVGPSGGTVIGNASTPPVNEFVDYIEVSDTGHVIEIASSPIDFDVEGNYNFINFADQYGNVVTPDSNTDTIEFRVDEDALYNDLEIRVANTADGDSVFDSTSSDSTLVNDDFVVFKNTSTLQSVTARGSTTDVDVQFDGNIFANGTMYVKDRFTIDPGFSYADDPRDSTWDPFNDSSWDSTWDNNGGTLVIAGDLEVHGMLFPHRDGTANQIVQTDGMGRLRLDTPNTTHVVEDPDATTESGTMYYTDTRVDNYLRSGNVQEIRFGKFTDSTETSTDDVAIITWNQIEGTLDVDLPENGATLQLGQESYYRVHAHDPIPNGTIVTFSEDAEVEHGHMLVDIADHNASDFSPERVLGVTTTEIESNSAGFVTAFGKVRNIDTSSYAVGTALYLDPTTPGAFTDQQPVTPDLSVLVGFVIRSDATNGEIFVRLNYSFTTDQLPEGNQNLYFTNERVNQALEVVNTESYDSTDSTYDSVNQYLGSLTINTSDSTDDITTFTYTGPHVDEILALLKPGIGVNYDEATGSISIGQNVAPDANVTFNQVTAEDGYFESLHPLASTGVLTVEGDMTIQGDLTIHGGTTRVEVQAEEVLIADNYILLNSDNVAGTIESAGIEIERGTLGTGIHPKLQWTEDGNDATSRWQLYQVGKDGGWGYFDILTTDDTVIDDVVGVDGIEVVNSSSDGSVEVGIFDRGIENIKLVNDHIIFTDGNGDSADDVSVELGSSVVITGDDDITVDLTTGGEIHVLHQTPTYDSSVDTIIPEAENEFVDHIAYNDTGHITLVNTSPINWDVADNWAFKTIVADAGDDVVADRNDDTLTISGGDDITVTGNASSDTITIDNTSNLDSVTSRGAVTENDITVGGVNILAGDSTSTGIVFEGANTDDYETTIGVVNPTADRTIQFPDRDGIVALEGQLNSILDDLDDVETSGKADGQGIKWDAAHSTGGAWVPADVVELVDLSADVDSTVVAGQPANLEYDNTTGLFTLTLGDYVMTTGDTMTGDLVLDTGVSLVIDDVTISQPSSYPSGTVELELPDHDGTIATTLDITDGINTQISATNVSVTTPSSTISYSNGIITNTPVDMEGWIKYNDGSRPAIVTGSGLTFGDTIELVLGGNTSADVSFGHTGAIGYADTDTSFNFQLNSNDTYFSIERGAADKNIIRASDIGGTSGEVILGAGGYNTVLTFANPNGNVTIDAGDRDSAADDITITIPNHSGRDGDSSYHAPEFMLTTSFLEELHDVDVTGRIQGSFLIWNSADSKWVMNDSESGFIPLAGTETGGEVTGQIEFDGGLIYINDSNDLGATNSIVFGTGSDASIYYDVTNNATVFQSTAGEMLLQSDILKLTANTSSEDVYLKGDWNSGNSFVTLYYNNVAKLETEEAGIKVLDDINMPTDGSEITIGASNELTITQNSSTGSITSTTPFTFTTGSNKLTLQSNGGQGSAIFIDGRVDVTGVTEFDNTTSNPLGTTTTGAVVIKGGAGIVENLTIGGGLHVDEDTVFDAETGSTHSDNGAVVVHGGVGIGENLNVGGNVVLGDNDSSIGTVTFMNDVNSNILPEATLTYDLGSDSQRWNTLYVNEIKSGSTTGTGIGITMGNIQVGVAGNNELDTSTGNLTIDSAGGTTTIDDNVIVTGTLHVDGQTTLASANIEDLTDNRIVIVGSAGELEDDINFTFDGTDFNIGQGQFTVEVATGDIYTDGNLNMNGVFEISNTTDSTVPSAGSGSVDGALRVQGGVGVAKDLRVGSDLYVKETLEVDGPTTFNNQYHNVNTGHVITVGSGAEGQTLTIAGDVVINHNLTVSGTVTTVKTEEINLADNVILLNSNFTGSPTEDAGIEVERGGESNVSFVWDETNNYWTVTGYATNKIHADIFEGKLDGIVYATNETTEIFNPGTNGTDAWARSDITSNSGVTILENGTDGTDATYRGDIVSEIDGVAKVLDNLYTGRIGDVSQGINVTDKSVYTGYVDGDVIGDIYSENGYRVFNNGTTSDGTDNTLAWFEGDHYGDVYDRGGTIKVLETADGTSSGTWLDVDDVYANIYAEDRNYIVLDTGDANGAGSFVRADVYAADGVTTDYKVLEAGSTGGDAWFKGDVKSRDNGTVILDASTVAGATVNANVTAPAGTSTFNNVTVTGNLDVEGNITTHAKKLILEHNESATDSTDDSSLDDAGIYLGVNESVYFKYDADGNQWVSSVPISGQITGAGTASQWDTARTVTFATGDVTGSFSIDGTADVTNVNLQVGDDSHNHTSAFITDFEEAVEDVVGGLISAAQLDATDGIVVTYNDGDSGGGDGDGTLTIAHADTSSISNVATPTTPTLGFEDFHVITGLDMIFDTYGHVLTTTPTYYNLDNRYYTETEADTRFVNVTGDTMSGNLNFSDAGEGTVYNSALTIMHDGDANITNTTGELYLQGDGITLQNQAGTENYITADVDGAVELYHNNIVRLATSADGADLTGNFDISVNATVGGTLDVDGQATVASLNVEDLTQQNGIVLVGVSGELETDDNFLYDGSTFTINTNKFTVVGTSGNTTIAGTLHTDGEATVASAIVEDLTNNRIVIAGTGGQLEDDSNFTFDGTTFKVGTNITDKFTVDVATGNTNIAGTLDVAGNMDFAGIVNFDNVTESTSNTTGAVVVDGGVGIVKNLNVGGAVDADGILSTQTSLDLGDSIPANFGAGNDLVIEHTGVNASIVNNTGNLTIQGASGASHVMEFKAGASKTFIRAVEDLGVTLYHNNVAKLSTTATGVEVEGNVNIDGGDVQLAHATYTTSITADEGTADNTATVPAVTGIMTTLTATAAPLNSNSTGTKGEVRYDANYVYVCVDTNTWSRFARDTW